MHAPNKDGKPVKLAGGGCPSAFPVANRCMAMVIIIENAENKEKEKQSLENRSTR